VQFLKGVGPRIGAVLESRGLRTFEDLLRYYPRDYQDRSQVSKVRDLRGDAPALLRGRIISYRFIPIRRLKRPLLEAVFQDETGRLSLKWFNYQRAYFEEKLKNQPEVLLYGAPKAFGAKLEILHPELEFLSVENAEGEEEAPGILPIYVEPEGITQRLLRRMLEQTLTLTLPHISDDLPDVVRAKYNLMDYASALRGVHQPVNEGPGTLDKLRACRTDAHRRLIFEDFFKFQWVLGRRRLKARREEAEQFPLAAGASMVADLRARLPFQLTADQDAALAHIHANLGESKPMNRLLQGDVGCGKTLVAFASALPVVAGGGQAALLAPTEILASQHLASAEKFLSAVKGPGGRALRFALLVGSTKKAARDKLLAALATGDIDVLIGTHALLEPTVVFKRLGLVIIDEQHRFGVDQRRVLREKGKSPHMLSLSATPIPRTLALTAYGDLDVTVIRQLPAGRPEVVTKIVANASREPMHERIRAELMKGRQAYIIYPLVEESEKMDLANAVHGAEDLANGPLSGFTVGLLHGRMKAAEKEEVMGRFKQGQIQALVSTTVVEVGVDVPNATVLVIENAERFGLSQLHQLRGRIGRGTEASLCFLVPAAGGMGDMTWERLKAMEETRDGFRLAELVCL
jgi:ATP-dependent DNA helicase RecG